MADNSFMKGKFLYIEPTNPKLNLADNAVTFPYEDYSMGVNLEVTIADRFSPNMKNGKTISFSSDNGTITFFGGSGTNPKEEKQGYLSTSYTDVSAANIGRGNKECIGIESINVSYQQWFYPVVTIRFVDVRGASLFMAQEKGLRDTKARGNDDITQIDSGSFFKAIFAFPSPVFKLTVKGFYGEPVSYNLRMSSFKADFDANTGNVIATVDFIGNMYGVYTEIPLIYAAIAPYLEKEYWESSIENRKFVFPNGNRMVTFAELYKGIKDAMNSESDEEKIAKEQINNTIGEAESATRTITELVDKYPFSGDDCKTVTIDGKRYKSLVLNDTRRPGNDIWGTIKKDDIIGFYKNVEQLSATIPELKEYVPEEYEYRDSFCKYIVFKNDDGITVKTYNPKDFEFDFFSNTQSQVNMLFDFKTKESDLNLTQNETDTIIDLFKFNEKENGTYYIHLAKTDVLEGLENAAKLKEKTKENVMEELKGLYIKKINDNLGFDLSIRNVFLILFAHMDTFINGGLYKMLGNVTNSNRTINDTPFNYWVDYDFDKNKFTKVPPFPLCIKEENDDTQKKTVAAWPEPPGSGDEAVIPETDFVRRMLRAADGYGKDAKEMLEEYAAMENNNDGENSDTDTKLRTDFVPLTLFDIANYGNSGYKNPYKWVVDSDKTPETKAKLITAVFVLRCYYYLYSNRFAERYDAARKKEYIEFYETINICNAFGEHIDNAILEHLKKPEKLIDETRNSGKGKPWDVNGNGIINNKGEYTFLTANTNSGNEYIYPFTSNFNEMKGLGESDFSQCFSFGGTFENDFKLFKNDIFETAYEVISKTPSLDEKIKKGDNVISYADTMFDLLTYNNEKITKEFGNYFYNQTEKKKDYSYDKVKKFGDIGDSTYFGIKQNNGFNKCFGFYSDADNIRLNIGEKGYGVFKAPFYKKQTDDYAKAYLFLFSIPTNTKDSEKRKDKYNYTGTDLKYYLLREGAYYWREQMIKENGQEPIVGNYIGFSNNPEATPCRKTEWFEKILGSEWIISLVENQEKKYESWKVLSDERYIKNVTEQRKRKLIGYFEDFAINSSFEFKEFEKLENDVSDEEFDRLQHVLVRFLVGKMSFIDYSNPLTDGGLLEGVGDSYTDIFRDIIDNLKKLYKNQDKDENSGNSSELTKIDTGIENDYDLCLSTYLTLKDMYDKFFANMTSDLFEVGTENSEYNKFMFVDSYYNDIGDRLLVNAAYLCDILESTIFSSVGAENVPEKLDRKESVFGFMSEICQKNNLTFLALPQKFGMSANVNGISEIENMFKAHPFNSNVFNDSKINGSYIALYPYKPSERLDVRDDTANYAYKSDGFDLVDGDDLPVSLSVLGSTDKAIPAFGVSFGKQNQSFFKSISLSTGNQQVTEHSIAATMDIASRGSMHEGATESTLYGQDLYRVYSNYSYQCTVEMMGNMQIMPLMYFQLNNIPMWHGAYMIISVEHTISAGDVVTKFTGVRVNKNAMPLVNDGYFYVNEGVLESYGGASSSREEGTDTSGNTRPEDNSNVGGYDEAEEYRPVPATDGKMTRKRAVTEAIKSIFGTNCGHGYEQHMCARWVYNLAKEFSKNINNDTANNCPPIQTGHGDANSDLYWNNLKKLGYEEKMYKTGLSHQGIISLMRENGNKSDYYDYGDVLVYYGGPKGKHVKFHTQFYVNDAYLETADGYSKNVSDSMKHNKCTSKWACDLINNWGGAFVYSNPKDKNKVPYDTSNWVWDIRLFKQMNGLVRKDVSDSEQKPRNCGDKKSSKPNPDEVIKGLSTEREKKIGKFVLDKEGGYVNDPRDKGGCTNAGVTIGTFKSYFGNDKTCGDVCNITNDEWCTVFRGFYDKMLINDINNYSIALLVFVMGWGSGIGLTVKRIQKMLGFKGEDVDGKMGSKTIEAINTGDSREMFNRLKKMRKDWIAEISKSKDNAAFQKGWNKVLNSIEFES